jgi:hypothetical protein
MGKAGAKRSKEGEGDKEAWVDQEMKEEGKEIKRHVYIFC